MQLYVNRKVNINKPQPKDIFLLSSRLDVRAKVLILEPAAQKDVDVLFMLVAHHIYGVAHTINCANYVFFRGLQKALTLNHPDVTQVFTGTQFQCQP